MSITIISKKILIKIIINIRVNYCFNLFNSFSKVNNILFLNKLINILGIKLLKF